MAILVKGDSEFLSKGSQSPFGMLPGLSYLGVVRQKGPTYGEQWVYTFQSAANNSVDLASPADEMYRLLSREFVCTLDAIGATHKLTVSCPVDPTGAAGSDVANASATQYELVGNEGSYDLREHPKALALGPDRMAIIDSVLNKEDGFVAASVTDGLSGQSQTDAGILYNLLKQRNGNATFEKSQFVFKYNLITSRQATIAVSYGGNNKIYTTAQMTTETGAPSGILSAIADAVASLPSPTIPSGVGTYTKGWLKKAPTATIVANNKIQLSGEFVLDYWSDWIYSKLA